MVAGWVKGMTEDVIGGAPLVVGKRYMHPDDGLIEITSGQYWGQHGLSNFWHWTVVSTGEEGHGYGRYWPEAPEIITEEP